MTAVFNPPQVSALLESLPQPAMAIGAAGNVVAANAKARDALETDPAGQLLAMVVRAPAVLQTVADVFQSGTPATVQYETRGTLPRNMDVHVAPLGSDADGTPLVLMMLHDLTYQQKVERMRSDFVANASHELRTPLASISGFIETLQGAARNDEKARENFLHLMQQQAQRMARLIDELLSLSRIETSEHIEPRDRVDLARIARQAVEMLAPLAKQTNCLLSVHAPDSLPVLGDAGQLSQVALNLVENAIKYAGTGKSVDVNVTSQESEAWLTVKDNGPGIAAHHVPRLTERFYRVNVQDSRMRGGTGLGLAIAKHIASRHRGRLVIESELGRGSSFSLVLPSHKNI